MLPVRPAENAGDMQPYTNKSVKANYFVKVSAY